METARTRSGGSALRGTPGGEPRRAEALSRLERLRRKWGVEVETLREREGSLLAFGSWRDLRVLLKVMFRGSDEWHAGRVTAAFGGAGVVGVHAHAPGAVLLEALSPATPVAELVAAGDDEAAVDALAGVVEAMARRPSPTRGVATAEAWGRSFARYLEAGGSQLPRELVRLAADCYRELCRSQSSVRLLHGDLHHHNVVRDARRGWVAIDPKGVVAELEYELGAALRNPPGLGALHATAEAASRRVEGFRRRLPVRPERVLGWAFSQAVLSAIWTLEDGQVPRATDAPLALATSLRAAVGRWLGASA